MLTPGVVVTTTAFDDQGQFSVNGQRADANYFTVDGVSANFGVTGYFPLAQTAQGALPALSVSGGTNSLVSMDAMQSEFRVQISSFAPEFGRTPGGQISILTRSGTNVFTARSLNISEMMCWMPMIGSTGIRTIHPSGKRKSDRTISAVPSVGQFSGIARSSFSPMRGYDCVSQQRKKPLFQTMRRGSRLPLRWNHS